MAAKMTPLVLSFESEEKAGVSNLHETPATIRVGHYSTRKGEDRYRQLTWKPRIFAGDWIAVIVSTN